MSVAALAVVVTCAAIGVIYIVARMAARMFGTAEGQSAPALFVKGVAPTAVALAIGFSVVLPGFLLFEPPHDGERAGILIVALAAVGALHVARTIANAVYMLRLSRSLTRRWSATAASLPDSRWGVPAFAIDAGFPVVAVAGLFRPRLFVDQCVLAACSGQELDAIAAHEQAHVVRRDNLRRLLIGACHGPASPTAAAWREAAERAADTRAADSPRRAVHLASALVKMARLSPSRTLECTALSTIHDGGSLEARVRHLVSLEQSDASERRSSLGVVLFTLPAVVALGLNWPTILESAHALTEAAVRHLP